MARELLGNEDAMRQVLRRCSPEAVALFARTGAGPRALAAEEELWEELFVRAGRRFRPAGWAAASAEGEEYRLEPSSWCAAFGASCPWTGTMRSGRTWRVHSGGLGLAAALEIAHDGDVVQLAPGLYRQHLVLARSIMLIGVNRDCVEVGSVRTEAEGAVLACLTVTGGPEEQSREHVAAVQVSTGTLRLLDCTVRGVNAVQVKSGTCHASCCDIQARHCCFEGAGELDACRLTGRAEMSLANHAGAQAVVHCRRGACRVTNCVLDGQSTDVGVWVSAGAKCEVTDSDVKAMSYGFLVEGSRSFPRVSRLKIENSRVHRCLGAGVRVEAGGLDVQLLDSEISCNAVGVSAEGWRRPILRGCQLLDCSPCRISQSPTGGGAGPGERNGKMKRPQRSGWTRGRGERSPATRLGINGCDFRCNQRAVETVTVDSISRSWELPLGVK